MQGQDLPLARHAAASVLATALSELLVEILMHG